METRPWSGREDCGRTTPVLELAETQWLPAERGPLKMKSPRSPMLDPGHVAGRR